MLFGMRQLQYIPWITHFFSTLAPDNLADVSMEEEGASTMVDEADGMFDVLLSVTE